MIQNKTARKLMYDWHDGQSSALYAAASSGLVKCWDNLLHACNGIDDETDRNKLIAWVENKQRLCKSVIIVRGSSYAVLPWVSRSYYV